MAFTVEDGTGLANSNSYASVEFADAYFADRGNQNWSGLTVENKQFALVAASDYIEARFGDYIAGEPLVTDPYQAMVFPRDCFVGIPVTLQKATVEYANRASVAALAPDIEVDPSGYQISERLEMVGPIQEKISFATIGSGSFMRYFKPYPAVDALMRVFLKSTTGRVIRN